MKGIFQAKGNIIQYTNKHLSTLLNIPLNKIIGYSIIDLFGEENKLRLQNAIEILNAGKGEIDRVALKAFNNLPELELRINLIEGKNNEELVVGTIEASIVQGVVRQNLLNSRYDALFEHALDCIVIYDYEKEQIVSVNKATVRTFGYNSKEEMIGLSRLDFVPKTSNYVRRLDTHKYIEDHKKRILNGESFSSKRVFIGKNGKEIFCNSKVIPTFDKKGEGMILIQNITKHLVERQSKKLVETKYRNIFENSHEAIIYIDPAKRTPSICNAKAMHLFGLTKLEDIKSLRLSDFVKEQIIDGIPVHEYYTIVVNKVIQNGRAETSFWVQKKSGEIIRVYAVLIKDKSDSENPKIICFIRNITDLYNAQLALEEKNKELEKYIASNLQLENFAYFASHDLQAPLNTILSFTKLLQKKLANDERKEVGEFLQFIVSSGEGMTTLINDLLAFSLVNTTNLEIQQINLEKQLYILLHSLDTLIKEKSAVIEVHNIPENIAIDSTKVKQVFQNLITNGIKFVKPGVQPKIIISCEEKVNHWIFSVKDNGIGIPQEYQDKIFGLFKRLHSSADYKGTGIGLAIVKKIIEQHKGNIKLISELGKGSTFSFTISKDLTSIDNTPESVLEKVDTGASVSPLLGHDFEA